MDPSPLIAADTRAATGRLQLVEAAAPWFAAEALVFERYWEAPQRSLATDLVWLRRQAYKELFDGVMVRVSAIDAATHVADPEMFAQIGPWLDEAREEFDHFERFAGAHQQLGGGMLDPVTLRADGSWAMNEELRQLREGHVRADGLVGEVATAFTEGGCCTLYAAGMTRAGHSRADELIARACAPVFADEVTHMRAALDRVPSAWTDRDWEKLTTLVIEQCRARVHMRDEQFGRPLRDADWEHIDSGELEPLPEAMERFGVGVQGEATTSA